MNHQKHKYLRTLAIAPSTYGFGFAVMDGFDTLADWGMKGADGEKNKVVLKKVKELMNRYQPELLVIPNTEAANSRRSTRIKKLTRKIKELGQSNGAKVIAYTLEEMHSAFSDGKKGTKHDIAIKLGERFPDELGKRVPPKRKLWQSEDSRMDIFEAVALALMPRLRGRKVTS